ncbi:SAM-dependent chlorinase/fluorinase [Roseivirga sp. UBA1976]|jgi:hypothetical protein|uniref:SAM hydrolase/SAM-dependent halogenase family protein n=1 Tax=Roseivirga sp. UBA1976 TaxID=1947386 RepID=UPI00257A486E|nr:SAM-dependent chlorinase/fluorinase [Roseivirga sp. UBA1976]MEC7753665.1 SAM-dependent chlorinase/fluorinase [Bacteroidota bacterium]|tara:strand:+ start:9162 stop:9917 length:756 start_codon:yes stop_codon:yes gene_type:complete
MTLITFTSDFGLSDHYVAQCKARILAEHPEAHIIDISHQIRPFDLAHLAHTVGSVFQDFPEGTIHLIGGEASAASSQDYLLAEVEKHFFVVPDSGILSLISERIPGHAIKLSIKKNAYREVPALVGKLAKGASPESLGEVTESFKQYVKRKSRATKKEISGHVIHVDRYGNLITNIEKVDFDILSRERRYVIYFGREQAHTVQKSINEVDPGDVFVVFTDGEKMMLGINQGNGSQLLGLEYDSPVTIQFED